MDLKARIEAIIDDHVYPCAYGTDLFVDGIDEAAAAILDEFTITTPPGADTPGATAFRQAREAAKTEEDQP